MLRADAQRERERAGCAVRAQCAGQHQAPAAYARVPQRAAHLAVPLHLRRRAAEHSPERICGNEAAFLPQRLAEAEQCEYVIVMRNDDALQNCAVHRSKYSKKEKNVIEYMRENPFVSFDFFYGAVLLRALRLHPESAAGV